MAELSRQLCMHGMVDPSTICMGSKHNSVIMISQRCKSMTSGPAGSPCGARWIGSCATIQTVASVDLHVCSCRHTTHLHKLALLTSSSRATSTSSPTSYYGLGCRDRCLLARLAIAPRFSEGAPLALPWSELLLEAHIYASYIRNACSMMRSVVVQCRPSGCHSVLVDH